MRFQTFSRFGYKWTDALRPQDPRCLAYAPAYIYPPCVLLSRPEGQLLSLLASLHHFSTISGDVISNWDHTHLGSYPSAISTWDANIHLGHPFGIRTSLFNVHVGYHIHLRSYLSGITFICDIYLGCQSLGEIYLGYAHPFGLFICDMDINLGYRHPKRMSIPEMVVPDGHSYLRWISHEWYPVWI